MRDESDRYQPAQRLASPKRMGSYLVDAGLLTLDQINVALNDQQATGMRFGDIIVARGWLKEQTVEWIMAKVIEPERRALKRQTQLPNRWANGQVPATQAAPTAGTRTTAHIPNSAFDIDAKVTATDKPAPAKAFVRREVPISKPLPSVGPSDGDVHWVG
jgi:hypothetical protein